MGTYVITPRSEAECNQLVSIMHSTGRIVSKHWAKPIRVGVPMMCFLNLGVYHTDVYDTSKLINPVHLQANELYSLLVDSEIIL